MILSHYVGRPSPSFDVYGFKGDISADLNERSRKLVEKHPDWRAYHGRIVVDAKEKHGWALDLLHVFVKNSNTGGHDAFGGDPKDLVPLSRPSPVKLGLGWPGLYNGPHHPNVADAELPPPLKVKWTFSGEKEFPGSPAVADGKVYCGNNDKRLYCIDARHWEEALGLRHRRPGRIDADDRGRQRRLRLLRWQRLLPGCEQRQGTLAVRHGAAVGGLRGHRRREAGRRLQRGDRRGPRLLRGLGRQDVLRRSQERQGNLVAADEGHDALLLAGGRRWPGLSGHDGRRLPLLGSEDRQAAVGEDACRQAL